MATHQQEDIAFRQLGQNTLFPGGQLAIDSLHLYERPLHRGSGGPDWTAVPEGLLLYVGRFLDLHTASNARSACKAWRRVFSLNVRTARLEIAEQRAAQARAFLRAFVRAFPSTTELVMDVTFRRTAREKIQAALEEHFQALHDFGLQALQLNLDLNSFNERKIKLPDVSLLASWAGLTRLTLQESGWRSQQLRVDAGTVFSSLPRLQELSVVCKYSGAVKAKWCRPPTSAERAAARMPTWPPGPPPPPLGPGPGLAAACAPPTAAAAAAPRQHAAASGAGSAAAPAAGVGLGVADGVADGRGWGRAPASGAYAGGGDSGSGGMDGRDAAMEDVQQQGTHQHQQHQPQVGALAAAGAPAITASPPRPVLTQHLRCQMTQNQSMSGELAKALRKIAPALQPHVSALTFEIVEETYAEPSRCTTPLELSALPGLKSLTLLSGAEDALAHSRLDIVGAASLERLVIFDVACGHWCYKKPGHGIPPRLLSAPPACLRSLTVVGFVVNQCQNLHALASLTCLEELRLEQPDPDSLAAVVGDLALTWLPPSLRVLKLHSVVLPPCGMEALAEQQQPLSYGGGGGAGGCGCGCVRPPTPPSYGAGVGGCGCAGPAPVATAPPPSLPYCGAGGGCGCPMPAGLTPYSGGVSGGGSAAAAAALYGVAPVAPLPQLRELYLSKCKVPTLGVLGVCPALTSLGLINCLSSTGLSPVPTAVPALRSLAVIHTLAAEQELGAACGAMGGGAVGAGPPNMPPMPPPQVYGGGVAGAAGSAGGFLATSRGGGGSLALRATTVAAAPTPQQHPALPVMQHVSGLPLPPVTWGSDEQVAAVAACRAVTSLELILPRGSAGFAAVAALASMRQLGELDVCLPCGPSECMMGLAALGAGGGAGGGGGGRLRRLTLWVDSRTCVNRNRARQLQAIQRALQAHMPHTLVEWAGAESRHSSWTGLEARVFNPH